MKRFIRPRRLKDEVVFTEEELPVFEYTPDGERIKKEKQVSDLAKIPSNLDEVVETFKGIFGEGSKDFVMRRIRLSLKGGIDAMVMNIDGLTDKDGLMLAFLSITEFAEDDDVDEDLFSDIKLAEYVAHKILPSTSTKVSNEISDVISSVVTGEAALFIQGCSRCVLFEVREAEHRSISEPETEKVIRGPHEGFTEIIRANTSLVRRRIRSPRLRLDSIQIGRLSKTDVIVAYIDGLTNPVFVEEMKKRISAIDIDVVESSGVIEEFIEDFPKSPFSQVQITERPDKFAASLSEGFVGVMMDGSPITLLAPVNFSAFFQSPDDYYEKSMFGGALRVIRYIAAFISLAAPAIYVAITTFHREMLPTRLALLVAGSRAPVPFPAYVEALIMELAIEFIREAGVRLPSPVGQTAGFVGALILGESAVSAGIVNPIMVIVVAMTTLASFVMPHYTTGLAIRLLRFPLLLLSAGLGLYGVMVGLILIGIHLSAISSLGVPYLETFMIPEELFKDVIWRKAMFKLNKRPIYLKTLDDIRQKKYIRTWDPETRKYMNKKAVEKTKEDEKKEANHVENTSKE